MLYTMSIDRDFLADDHEIERWLITRRPPKRLKRQIKYVPDLAPSEPLLQVYLKARSEGLWCREYFQEHYVPRYLNEIASNPRAQELLRVLEAKVNVNEHVILYCYCDSVTCCHRRLVVDILLERGCSEGNILMF